HNNNLSPADCASQDLANCKTMFGKRGGRDGIGEPCTSLPECARVASGPVDIGTPALDYDNQQVVIVSLYICKGTILDGTLTWAPPATHPKHESDHPSPLAARRILRRHCKWSSVAMWPLKPRPDLYRRLAVGGNIACAMIA